MYQIDVTLEGIADFLYNRFSIEAKKKWGGGVGGQRPTDAQRMWRAGPLPSVLVFSK